MKCKTLREVISQYINSPDLRSYINSFVDTVLSACNNTKDLENALNIDHVTGDALDVIGAIVGQDRIWVDLSPIGWFGFEDGGSANNKGFDEGELWDGQSSIAGNFTRADDTLLRKLIQSKIIKNSGSGSINDILQAIEILTGRTDIEIKGAQGVTHEWFGFSGNPANKGFDIGEFWNGSAPDTTTMEYNLVAPTGDPLSDFDKLLLSNYGLLPTPAGVLMTGITP